MAESLMDKERHRWSYMTENQLTTRLKRITKPEKLRCFIQLAIDRDNRLLEHLATEKLYSFKEEEGGDVTFGCFLAREIMPLKKKKVKKVNTSSKKKTEDNIRTILI